MLKRLQEKWKVSFVQLILIICTFALGGSATGIIARKCMQFIAIEQRVLWLIVYILLVTLLWPFMVLLISIPFGQFTFFRKYIQKIFRRFRMIK
ncbi:MAG: DUF6787 family protein [Chitinophagaceae bacterium]